MKDARCETNTTPICCCRCGKSFSRHVVSRTKNAAGLGICLDTTPAGDDLSCWDDNPQDYSPPPCCGRVSILRDHSTSAASLAPDAFIKRFRCLFKSEQAFNDPLAQRALPTTRTLRSRNSYPGDSQRGDDTLTIPCLLCLAQYKAFFIPRKLKLGWWMHLVLQSKEADDKAGAGVAVRT